MIKIFQNFPDQLRSLISNKNLPDIQYNLDELMIYQQEMLKGLLTFWQIKREFSACPVIVKEMMKFGKTPLRKKKISTSGTTADPFHYFVWEDVFAAIEIDNHYKYVLKEFDLLDKPISVLRINVEPHKGTKGYQKIEWKGAKFWLKKFHSDPDYFVTHAAEGTFYHFIYPAGEIEVFCDYLLNVFFPTTSIDVFLTPFSFVSILLSQMKSPQRIAYLISNINEGVLENEVSYLLENKVCDYFCDHMRCWDGGMTFITCKHGQKHILDYLSYVESIDNMLVSTDFFNLVGAFIRYWNGDYIELDPEWKKCACGRYYRDFRLEGNRKPFLAVGNMTSWEVGGVLRIWLQEMSQAICYKNKIVIVTTKELNQEKQAKIRSLIPAKIEFKINQFEISGRFGKILKVIDKTNCSN